MVAPQAAGGFLSGLLVRHAALDALEVALPLTGIPLSGVDAAPGPQVRAAGCGHCDVHLDLVVETHILVDVGGRRLAGGNGPDDGGGAGDAVAAGEHALHIGDLGAGVGRHISAPLDLDAAFLQATGLNALADSDDNGIHRDAQRLHRGCVGPGTARLVDLVDDLRLSPQGCHMAAFVRLNLQRRLQRQDLGAFGNGALHFLLLGGHVLLAATVDTGDLGGAQPDGAAGHIHGHVAAADDRHVLAGEVRHLVVADAAQQLHGGHDARTVLTLDAGLLVGVGADGDIYAVVFLLELVEGDILAHLDPGMYLDAQGQDGVDLGVQLLPGETVAGDAVAHHATQLALLLVDGDLVAHVGQVVGGGEATGAAAHDGDGLAGGRRLFGLGHVPGVVHGVALESADVQSVVHHVPAAAGLAGMLADVGAGNGEGVVLADEPHSVGAAAFAHQGNVAGNVHASGTQGHTGHRVFQSPQAAVVENVLLIVVPEALQAHQHQIGGIDADGAVRRVHDDLGGVFDAAENADLRLTFQYFTNHVGKLGEADAAGYTLAAGLGLAQIQEVQGHVHRAQPRRAGSDPPLHIAVQLLHHGLCLIGHFDF